jgi:hypothetical protein
MCRSGYINRNQYFDPAILQRLHMIKRYLVALLLILGSASCVRKTDLNFNNLQYTNWTPDWALPFVSSSLNLQNMLNSGTLISTDATGLLSLGYSGKGYSFQATDVIRIPDLHFNTPPVSLTTPITSLPVGNTVSDSSSGNFSYSDSAGSHLNHIGMKAGSLHMQLTSSFNQNVNLKIVFPGITKNSVPLSLTVAINYPNTTSNVYADLSGYTLDMTNGGTTQNYIAYKINYTLTGTGNAVGSPAELDAAIDFTGIKFSYIDGNLGQYIVPIPSDSINVGVLNKSIAANIKLQNPMLHVNFTSSFGMTVSAAFDSLYGVTTATGAINDIVIPGISIAGESSIGAPAVQSSYTIDSTNSTLRNILSPVPNVVVYNGHFAINPTPSSTYNFITDTSKISFTINAELPACFQIIQLAMQDTLQMQMPPDTSLLTNAQFMVQVSNAFPVYANVQLYFTDSNYVVLDSLVSLSPPNNFLIGPATVNSSGIVTAANVSTSSFAMSQARYSKMASRVRHGLVRGNLYTSGTGMIQLHATDHLEVKTAFRFTLNYSL